MMSEASVVHIVEMVCGTFLAIAFLWLVLR